MLRIKLVKSPIGNTAHNRSVVKALGLRKMHQTVEHDDNPSIRGMIHRVKHLLHIEIAEGTPTRKKAPAPKAKAAPAPVAPRVPKPKPEPKAAKPKAAKPKASKPKAESKPKVEKAATKVAKKPAATKKPKAAAKGKE